jgi:putative ABC transport system ATP-binding protein
MTVTILPGPGGWPEQDPPPPSPPRPKQGSPPLIQLSALRLRAGEPDGRGELTAPLDLTVPRGEMVMLTGQPRSGRSALLNVLGLLDFPAAGSYLLDGVDTATLRDGERSALRGRQIGMVFQRKMVLPTLSVLDNVMLPLRYAGLRRRQRISIAAESLDHVGLTAMARLPAWHLSAGEIALCAVARALVTRPSLILCDEPTAGLDQSAATRVVGALADLHRDGGTLLIATAEHRAWADQLATAYSARSVRLGQPAGPFPVTETMRLPIPDSQADSLQ